MRSLTLAALAAVLATPALAQEQAPICTDRPTKANSVCTVPVGRWQVEADAVNFTRFVTGGARTDTTLVANATLKYGLDDRSDLEVNWAPFVEIDSRAGAAHVTDRESGDIYLRYKRRLSTDDARVGVSIIPFVKAPTARRGVGNGEWEGGVAMPVSLAAPAGFTLTFGPEVDLLADADGSGRHANLVNIVNVARPVGDNLTLMAEVWTASNFDPQGTITQASADVALAWGVTSDLQLDMGANVGLNPDTPDLQFYAGLSRRF